MMSTEEIIIKTVVIVFGVVVFGCFLMMVSEPYRRRRAAAKVRRGLCPRSQREEKDGRIYEVLTWRDRAELLDELCHDPTGNGVPALLKKQHEITVLADKMASR